jgi:hypothetical protein
MTLPADAAAIEFESRVDATLQICCELGRDLVGAHQDPAIYTDANYLARLDDPADAPGIVSWPRV